MRLENGTGDALSKTTPGSRRDEKKNDSTTGEIEKGDGIWNGLRN
jgi:hypothetical protein